jgi:hypothetical protein
MAESLDSLVSYYPHVIVGTVDRLVETTRQDSQLPDGTLLPGPEVTVFAVSVDEVIQSDGRTVPKEILLGRGGDQAPKVGETYLMLLEDLSIWSGQPNYYAGPAFGRFRIDGSRRVVPNGREHTLGVAAVSGASGEQVLAIPQGEGRDLALAALATRTVDEAAAIIRDAATRASPVPTQPPRFPPSPAPTPTPTTPVTEPSGTPTPAASPTTEASE